MEPANKHNTQTDEELLKLYSTTGDKRWLGVLLQRYTVLLLGVGLKYLKNRDKATDAVQQVFLKVLTVIDRQEIQNFKGWLYILMRNCCLDILKETSYDHSEEITKAGASPAPDKRELYHYEWTLEQLKESVLELEEGQRLCIRLFYFEKKSYKQITDQTGLTFMQVKSYIQNGKLRLKKIMTDKLANQKHRND